MLQRSIHLNYVCRTETQTVFQTVAYLCLSLASIFNIVCMTICLDRFTILSLPCIFNIGSGQMPQECERHQQVGPEGAAGDGGGEGQGGGQAASTGALVQYEWTACHDTGIKPPNTRKRFLVFQEVESTGPLTGLGFFDIERCTLTSMISTALTYIIILVQFKMSTI